MVMNMVPYSFRREADDEFALDAPGTYQHQVAYRLGWLREYRSEDDMRLHALSSVAFEPDQEASLVIDLLAQTVDNDDNYRALGESLATGNIGSTLIERFAQSVEDRAQSESDDLTAAFAAAPSPADWGPDAIIADGQLVVSYIGPAQLPAGTSQQLRFAVENRGSEDVGRIWGMIRSDLDSPFWEEELVVGRIPAGETVEAVINFDVPPRSFTTEERFALDLRHSDDKEPLLSEPVSVQLVGAERPRLGLSWELADAGQMDLDQIKPYA